MFVTFVCCHLVFEFSVGIGGFVIGMSQISFFILLIDQTEHLNAYHPLSKYNVVNKLYTISISKTSLFADADASFADNLFDNLLIDDQASLLMLFC